jgi:hypothetical protein
VILLGITSSKTRNPLEEFHPWTANTPPPREKSDPTGNYQLIDEESTGKMVFPLGITSSGMKNSPEEWDTAGNNQLMEADSDRQDQNLLKILKTVSETMSGSATTTFIYYESQLF